MNNPTIYELARRLLEHLVPAEPGEYDREIVIARNGTTANLLRRILEHPCALLPVSRAVALEFCSDLPQPSSEVRLTREGATYTEWHGPYKCVEAIAGNPIDGLEAIANRRFEDLDRRSEASTVPPSSANSEQQPEQALQALQLCSTCRYARLPIDQQPCSQCNRVSSSPLSQWEAPPEPPPLSWRELSIRSRPLTDLAQDSSVTNEEFLREVGRRTDSKV